MPGPDYQETRFWTYWLRIFTVGDLAEAMAVTPESLHGFLRGLVRNGTVKPCGSLNGGSWDSMVFEFVPLPPGPTHHPHGMPPERLAGYDEVLCPRGLPVRIRTERDQRKSMSTPGARGHIRRREQRYQKMQAAVEERRQRQRAAPMSPDEVGAANRRARDAARVKDRRVKG